MAQTISRRPYNTCKMSRSRWKYGTTQCQDLSLIMIMRNISIRLRMWCVWKVRHMPMSVAKYMRAKSVVTGRFGTLILVGMTGCGSFRWREHIGRIWMRWKNTSRLRQHLTLKPGGYFVMRSCTGLWLLRHFHQQRF